MNHFNSLDKACKHYKSEKCRIYNEV